MDRSTPEYDINHIQALVRQDKVRITQTALSTAAALGYDFAGITEVILELTAKDFDKCTNSINNHQEWQDVYKPFADNLDLYIKFKVVGDVVILSFKERT